MEVQLEHAIQILLIGASFGICIFILALLWHRENAAPSRYLAVFFSANIVNQLDEWFWHLNLWQIAPWFTHAYMPFLYLLAPSFYLYVKHLTIQNQGSTLRTDAKHGFGFVASLILCIPYYALDHTTKLARLAAPSGSLEHLGFVTWGPTIALILLLPFSLGYLVAIVKLLTHHLNTIKSYFSNIDNRDLSWIRWSIIALMVTLVVSGVRIFLPPHLSEMGWQNIVFLSVELTWLLVVGILSIHQRPIYENAIESERAAQCTSDNDTKYQNSPMSPEDVTRLQTKLTLAMQENLYSDPNLTLRKLSDITGIAEIKISQVLNTEMNMGFYDFINSWRIQAACKQMEFADKTILDIAFDVGFNSRSTFNQAFKKHTQTTPSAFRKQLVVAQNASNG